MRFQVSQGLKIKTPKGEIELEPGRLVDLPEAKATPLIQAGKIIFLPDPNLLCLFRKSFEKAVAAVGACYIPGTLEIIREDFPDLSNEIDQAEDQINDFWLKAWKGPVDVGTFREAVERWRTLHLRAIRFFSLIGRPEYNTQLSQDLRSMNEIGDYTSNGSTAYFRFRNP